MDCCSRMGSSWLLKLLSCCDGEGSVWSVPAWKHMTIEKLLLSKWIFDRFLSVLNEARKNC